MPGMCCSIKLYLQTLGSFKIVFYLLVETVYIYAIYFYHYLLSTLPTTLNTISQLHAFFKKENVINNFEVK